MRFQDGWEDHDDCAEVALCKSALGEAERVPMGGRTEPHSCANCVFTEV